MAQDEQGRASFDPASVLNGRGPGQSRLQCAPGDAVYAQDSSPDTAFYVEHGIVKISFIVPSGKEAVVGIRHPGDFFGTRCLVGRRMGNATALTECSLIRITAAALLHMLREVPDLAVMFAAYLVSQSIEDQSNLVDQLTNSAERRLARTLLRLAHFNGGGDLAPIPGRINQTVLADMVGTTRSRVNFFMNKFKREGLIEYNRLGDIAVRSTLSRVLAEW
jgi:CRP/FNR family transcriptional regulator, cyclic AMP receptor protein